MNNIGYVLYKKSKTPGTLHANCCHSAYGIGPGIDTGGSADGFRGLYQIRYFDKKGNFQAERELDIRKDGNCYKVSWLNNGELTAYGIGLNNSEGLSVGYRDIKAEKQ